MYFMQMIVYGKYTFNTNIRDISTNESTTENENKITPRLNLDVLKKDDETLLVNS